MHIDEPCIHCGFPHICHHEPSLVQEWQDYEGVSPDGPCDTFVSGIQHAPNCPYPRTACNGNCAQTIEDWTWKMACHAHYAEHTLVLIPHPKSGCYGVLTIDRGS